MNKVIFALGLMAILLLQGCKPMTAPDFQHLTLPKYPNYYLVCPKDYCNVTPNAYTPIYPVSAEDLFDAFNQMIAQQQRTNFVYSMPETGQYTLKAKTPLGWVDDISVQFIALPNNQSTLAIISKSRYGLYDFGMNKKRLDSWLLQLGQIVMNNARAAQTSSPSSSTDQTATAITSAPSDNSAATANQSPAATNPTATDVQPSATATDQATAANPPVASSDQNMAAANQNASAPVTAPQ